MTGLQNYRKSKKGVLTNTFQHIKERCSKYNRELDFDLKWLHERFITDPYFIECYEKWISSGMCLNDRPTVDRMDHKKGYLKNNVQILTWKQNRDKSNSEQVQIKSKKISKLTASGDLIMNFDSVKLAASSLNISQGLISNVLIGKRNHTHGYKFIYQSPELINQVNKQ